MDYIQTNGYGFSYQGKAITLRGFGVGGWLNLEHYMVGFPTPDSMIRLSFSNIYGKTCAQKFWDDYAYNFLQEEDIQLIKSCGANFLRVPFNYRLLLCDNDTDSWQESGFLILKHLLDLCEGQDLFVVLDMHTSPGGQNPDWHCDNSNGKPLFWEFQTFRRQLTAIWAEIARRFHNYSCLFGYDLLNEPAMCNWDSVNEFYAETIQAIRRYDTHHIIVLEGDNFAMDFHALQHFDDPQISLSFHFYPVCWQAELADPSCNREARIAGFRNVLQSLISQCKEYGTSYFCGEFGYEYDEDNPSFAMEMLHDTAELFREAKLNWVVWSYKDARYMSLVVPKESSNWMRLVRKIGHYWSQDIEKKQSTELLKITRETWYPEMTASMEYQLSFRIRALLYELQSSYILETALKDIPWEILRYYPEDYLLQNCEVRQDYFKEIQDAIRE